MIEVQPSQRMRNIGVVQHGAGILAEPARPFDLPAEQAAAEQAVDQLFAVMERLEGEFGPYLAEAAEA